MYHCSNAENSNGYGTWKRDDVEPGDGLIFLLGPGGRAAVITKQIPEPVPQGPLSQDSPSTILVPLSSSGEPSATVAEASDTPLGTTTRALPSASTPETSLALVSSASTNEASSSGVATESSLQTAIPSTISSEAVNGKPPVYIGIVLGTIAGIACLAALLTWWIRIRSHAKRRHLYGDTDIPWAPSENIDGGLEEAREVTQARSREDLVQVEAWQPRGDCGIGEPRRSECHQKDFTSSFKKPLTPTYNEPYAHRTHTANPNDDLTFVQPCRNGPYPNARPLPSYLRSINSSSSGSVDDHSSASSLGPLRVANLLPGDRSAATSRAGTVLDMNSQVYSLGSEDIKDLINTESCSTLDQRTNSTLSLANTAAVLKEIDTVEKHETPSTTTAHEGWATSLKSIFAVMASNLSTRRTSVRRKDDRFTPIPRKRSAAAFSSESDTQRDIVTGPYRPHISLDGRRGTKSRQLRRDLLWRSREGLRGALDSTPSRASSIYSTASATYQSDQCGEIPTRISQNFDINRSGVIRTDTLDRNKETSWCRPTAITRVSSTGCSVGSTQLTENEEAAQRALIDRRGRAKRSDEWVEGEARIWRTGQGSTKM